MPILKENDVYAGRYLLLKLIGEGGFSEVWKARDGMTDNAVVAIKIYAPEKGLEDYGIHQFSKEYSIAHLLSHPHLMKVYHFDVYNNSPYLIMPYYQEGSLSRRLYTSGKMQEDVIATLMHQIGGALEALHIQKPIILHQDIKPDNILICDSGRFILTDFGISSQTRHTIAKATSGLKSLTIAYSPPERFSQVPYSDESSDIFSFGVTLYEACTCKIPWEGHGGQSLLKGAQVPVLPKEFPDELNKMIQACLAIDPKDRPTASKIKEWGNHYLENKFWNYNNDKGKKKINHRMMTIGVLVLSISVYIYFYGLTIRGMKQPSTIENFFTSQPYKVPAEDKGQAPIHKNLSLIDSSDQEVKSDTPSSLDTFSIDPAKKKNLTEITKQSGNLEESFNQISNPGIARKIRKVWMNELMQKFDHDSVAMYEEKKSFLKRHTLQEMLILLLDMPHEIKITKVVRNSKHKIVELNFKMNVLENKY